MATIFDLQKRQEKVAFILEKRAIKQAPVMRVGAAFDVSGSARDLYRNGVIQATVDRLVPVAMKFDDNGEMDCWSFDNRFNRLATVGKHDYDDYVAREIIGNDDVHKWGSTLYAGVMADMQSAYFGAEPKPAAKPTSGFFSGLFGAKKAAPQVAAAAASLVLPAMGLFITDGANNDRPAAAKVMRDGQAFPMYWQLVGVGDPREFGFLREMADELPNVGFVHLHSLSISDDELYDQLLSDELCAWVKAR